VQEGRGAAPEVDQDGEDGLFMHMAVDEEERAAAAHPVVEAFDAFPQEFFNTYSSRAQPGSFYASMAEGIKQTYDGAAAPSSAPRANEQFKNYDPFPNASIMLLSIFFAVSSIKKKDLNLLLDLLKRPEFDLNDLPKSADVLKSYLAHIKEKSVKSDTPGFFPVSVIRHEGLDLGIIHPGHTIKMLLSLPQMAPYFSRSSACPIRRADGAVLAWTESEEWRDHPFSSLGISNEYFRASGVYLDLGKGA